MSQSANALDRADEAILNDDVSDRELEIAAAKGNVRVANPTAPFAIICIPFERT